MIPLQGDPVEEVLHWQRYQFFRPWYMDQRVIDAGCGEGYGIGYAGAFAVDALGLESCAHTLAHAQAKYPHVRFENADALEFDFSNAELVLCFELLEWVENPRKLLKALGSCVGRIVISMRTRDVASRDAFTNLIQKAFPDRQVRFLSQRASWPCNVQVGLLEGSCTTIAVIGDGELPQWPRIGLAMPTLNQADQAREAIFTICKHYPGELHVALVANGTQTEALIKLRSIERDIPEIVRLIELEQNIGYGQGANAGMEALWTDQWYDFFGVTNDDILCAVDGVCEIVAAFDGLMAAGHRPGIVGPVSNEVSGPQRVDIGAYSDYAGMLALSSQYHRSHHSSAREVKQLRGLFFLMTPDCLSDVGGFDPRFGLGNFEDDDLNVRVSLAGHSMWIAEGAFLHHAGSSTFRSLGLDYQANIQRNLELFLEKWHVKSMDEALSLGSVPVGAPQFVPLTASIKNSGFRLNLGGEDIDLVYQASITEFAGWTAWALGELPREARAHVLQAVEESRSMYGKACA